MQKKKANWFDYVLLVGVCCSGIFNLYLAIDDFDKGAYLWMVINGACSLWMAHLAVMLEERMER
jgi:uncharacterized membrane protein HdeD (DUF308 family)